MIDGPTGPEHRDHRRYDAYATHHDEHGSTELIPAATVIVLRDTPDGLETLMLHKNSKIAFGGMWVFPGGRIDDADEVLDENGRPDELATAAAAAVREAAEEASVTVDPDEMVWFARWIPPPVMPRRFATFFFAARLEGDAGSVAIDDGEITDHEWMRPADAMARRDAGTIELAPPTWMTLNQLAAHTDVAGALAEMLAAEPAFYETHMARTDNGPVAMWEGDCGYETTDPTMPGARHRLTMVEDRYRFEDDRS